MQNNTINGRTHEEIKRGLECCIPRYESNHWVTCNDECPYRSEGAFCRNVMQNNVRAYIQQLERERDAAVKYLAIQRYCMTCTYNNVLKCDECKGCFMTTNRPNWQWRGVEEGSA